MTAKASVIPAERVEQAIFLIRSQKVMLDSDLAALYGVETKALIQAAKRNSERFPEDFMFRLTPDEFERLRLHIGTSNVDPEAGEPRLRSQTVTSNVRHGGRRYPPYAFTEQGVAMLSGVLRGERAVAVNIEIMRTFVRLRQLLATNEELSRKLDALERKYDRQFKAVFDAIRQLMAPPVTSRRAIGLRKADR